MRNFNRLAVPILISRLVTFFGLFAPIFAITMMASTSTSSRVIYASSQGGMRMFEGHPVETIPLHEAVRDVRTDHTDTVIQLVEGHYDLKNSVPITITRHPQDKKPFGRIIVRGLGSATVIDGRRDPVNNPEVETLLVNPTLLRRYLGVSDLKSVELEILRRIPHIETFSCFRIANQTFVEIERLSIRNCWEMAVFVIDSSYVTLRDTIIIGSTYAFHAFGTGSHHLLLEGNHWIQDASARHRMWRDICWSAIKGYVIEGHSYRACPLEGKHVLDYTFFNGAFFGSWNIAGGVIVRKNSVSNAFNGIRMDAPRSRRYLGRRNVNVEIYNNTFRHIRDNPIEPESTATNWWVHHNQIFNAHSWFSFDAVSGGEWYIFGNTGWFDAKPYIGCNNNPACAPCAADPSCNLAWSGKVLKFNKAGPYPSKPVYLFNNSWYLRTVVAGKGTTRNLRHWNNAIQFCKPKGPDDRICRVTNRSGDPDAELCGPQQHVPQLRFFHKEFKLMLNHGNRFDYDISNRCFPQSLTSGDQESHGVVAIDGEPIFKAPETGDFRLPPASPARNRGKIIELRGRVSWTSDADDGKPDIGAYEGNRPMRGPPYRHFDVPDLYRERPRIIDVAWYRDEDKSKNKSELRISFSIEVEDVNTLNDPRVIIRHENNTPYEADVCRTNNATLICTFLADLPLPLDRSVQIQLPFGIRSVPQDGQSEPMTLWASTYPNISIRHPGR